MIDWRCCVITACWGHISRWRVRWSSMLNERNCLTKSFPEVYAASFVEHQLPNDLTFKVSSWLGLQIARKVVCSEYWLFQINIANANKRHGERLQCSVVSGQENDLKSTWIRKDLNRIGTHPMWGQIEISGLLSMEEGLGSSLEWKIDFLSIDQHAKNQRTALYHRIRWTHTSPL